MVLYPRNRTLGAEVTGNRDAGPMSGQHHGQIPKAADKTWGQKGLSREFIPETGEKLDS